MNEQVINEITRDYYNDWGLISPTGKIISGHEHPTARTHNELSNIVKRNQTAEQKSTDPISDHAEFLDEKGRGMALRTYNKASIGAAIKGLKVLPSSTGIYHHNHGDDDYGMSGTEMAVRRHLNKLHADFHPAPLGRAPRSRGISAYLHPVQLTGRV